MSLYKVKMCVFFLIQARAALEKTKQTLEVENTDLANDLKQVQQAKQESERKRKQAESSLSETMLKMAEAERAKSDQGEKLSKFTAEIESMSTQLEQSDIKVIQLGQKTSSLESQLADAQVCYIYSRLSYSFTLTCHNLLIEKV